MPTHENLDTLRNSEPKRGLAGAVGGHLEVAAEDADATVPGSSLYDVQRALGDPFNEAWNSATGESEVVTLTEATAITAGVFTLTFDSEETAEIAFDATAEEVEAALNALDGVHPGDVEVSGGPIGTTPFTLTFGGQLVNADVGAVTADQTGLTGTFTIAVANAGVA